MVHYSVPSFCLTSPMIHVAVAFNAHEMQDWLREGSRDTHFPLIWKNTGIFGKEEESLYLLESLKNEINLNKSSCVYGIKLCFYFKSNMARWCCMTFLFWEILSFSLILKYLSFLIQISHKNCVTDNTQNDQTTGDKMCSGNNFSCFLQLFLYISYQVWPQISCSFQCLWQLSC